MEIYKQIFQNWICEEKKSEVKRLLMKRQDKNLTSSLLVVFFWKCEIAEQMWITVAKLTFELRNTKYK